VPALLLHSCSQEVRALGGQQCSKLCSLPRKQRSEPAKSATPYATTHAYACRRG
jgi:hypothetical protein